MNFDLIELRHLRSFLVTAERLNFHQAAEELNLSQPALSRQIALMEEALGIKLFTRLKKRVQLTPAGLYVRGNGQEVLRSMQVLLKEAREVGEGQRGTISVGYTEGAMASFLPSLLRKARSHLKGITIHLRQGHSDQLAKEVRRGRLDLAFTSLEMKGDGLKSTLVAQERVGIVMPDTHRHKVNKEVLLKDFAFEKFILFAYQDNPQFYSDILGWCQSSGFVPQLAEEAPTRILAVNQVAAGMGITFLSEHLAHYCGAGTVFRLIKKPRALMRFYMVEVGSGKNPVVQELKKLVLIKRDRN